MYRKSFRFKIRLLLGDFNRLTCRRTLNAIVKRASPDELIDYCIAKLLITISIYASPFSLFHEILSHAVVERRKQNNPSFLDMSRSKIGRQSLANRLNPITACIKFEWLGKSFTKDTLRAKLKSSFFSYLLPPLNNC